MYVSVDTRNKILIVESYRGTCSVTTFEIGRVNFLMRVLVKRPKKRFWQRELVQTYVWYGKQKQMSKAKTIFCKVK
jgi:hypothetical protein